MKNNLKIALGVILMLSITNVQAQIKFGPEAGVNLSTMTLKTMGLSIDPKTLVGFHVGGVFDIPLKGSLSLQPAILYSSKGSKFSVGGEDMSIAPGFIEVPVNLAYSFEAGTVKFFVFAGPYLAYGISGKYKSGGVEESIKYGSGDNYDLKPFDLGLNLGAGLNINNFLVTAQYGLGLTNLSPSSSVDLEMKNKVIGISVAYLFSLK
jgi:Outer membrane protein beta-barrel domain